MIEHCEILIWVVKGWNSEPDMAGKMVSLIIHSSWFFGTFFFFFWPYPAKPLSRLYLFYPRGVSLFTQKPSVTWPFQCPSRFYFEQGECCWALCTSYLRSVAIPFPNSTTMGHLRALELDEVSSIRPVGVAHRKRVKIVGLMTLGAASSSFVPSICQLWA